jgi:hypothetical protein
MRMPGDQRGYADRVPRDNIATGMNADRGMDTSTSRAVDRKERAFHGQGNTKPLSIDRHRQYVAS